MSAELRGLNTMVYRTLEQVFPSVRPIPDELTLWLASSSAELSIVPLDTLGQPLRAGTRRQPCSQRGQESVLEKSPAVQLSTHILDLLLRWIFIGT
jgi:hypothetical protein